MMGVMTLFHLRKNEFGSISFEKINVFSDFFTILPLWVLGLTRSRIHASQTETVIPAWPGFMVKYFFES